MHFSKARPAALALALVSSASLVGCGDASEPPKTASDAVPAAAGLRVAIDSPSRPADERARDAYRHPEATLEFFGLRPDANVVELSPGAGWYTAILAPVVRDHGKLSVTVGNPNSPSTKSYLARLAASPAVFDRVNQETVDWKGAASLGADGSADLVLTFRSVHNWVEAGVFDAVLAASFKVLKPGGVLGLEEHRAKPGTPADPKTMGETGYVPEAFVIERATAAGFKLAGKSEINANPNDTKDYPKGVWTLPPSYALGDVDHAKYAQIGESDRMTLKFVKP